MFTPIIQFCYFVNFKDNATDFKKPENSFLYLASSTIGITMVRKLFGAKQKSHLPGWLFKY